MVGDIKNIIVFQSLSVDDKKTGQQLYDDTIKMHINYKQPAHLKMTHQFYDVPNKNSFVEMLIYLGINSKYMNGGIVVHLEMHGAENKSGLILGDGSFIGWEELSDLFRVININTKNNLYITMATCFGRYLYLGASTEKKSPYSGFISASKKVIVSEVISDFTIIYEYLIASGNLVSSFLELDKLGSNFYYKDSLTTFEENFEAFKNNPDFKNKVLGSATKTIIDKGGEVVDEPMSTLLYNELLNLTYQKQKQNFDFND